MATRALLLFSAALAVLLCFVVDFRRVVCAHNVCLFAGLLVLPSLLWSAALGSEATFRLLLRLHVLNVDCLMKAGLLADEGVGGNNVDSYVSALAKMLLPQQERTEEEEEEEHATQPKEGNLDAVADAAPTTSSELENKSSENEGSNSSYKFARVLFDYKSEQSHCLSVTKGSIVQVSKQHHSGWWLVQYRGKSGYVPFNFLLEIDAPTLPIQQQQQQQSDVKDRRNRRKSKDIAMAALIDEAVVVTPELPDITASSSTMERQHNKYHRTRSMPPMKRN